MLESTSIAIPHDFAHDVHIHVACPKLWVLNIPPIEHEIRARILPIKRTRHLRQRKPIPIQKARQHRLSQVSKHSFAHYLSTEVHGVLHHYDRKLNELHHRSRKPLVLMIKERVTKVDLRSINNRFEISIYRQGKITTKFQIKVFKFQVHFLLVWEKPRIDALFSVYFPLFKGWEVDCELRWV